MKKNSDKQGRQFSGLEELSAETLRGKQSVRATFRLPPQVITLLSVAASQLGVKQKSLFDQLVEDRDVLSQLARAAETQQQAANKRQQKTYVVSRNALLSLEHVAKSLGMPRDYLVEISIQRLVPVLNSEQEKNSKREQLSHELEELSHKNEQLLQLAADELGEEDGATELVAELQLHFDRVLTQLNQLVEQGRELGKYQ
nr:hypothetical protein [uncultured Desulfobulbus sp.]